MTFERSHTDQLVINGDFIPRQPNVPGKGSASSFLTHPHFLLIPPLRGKAYTFVVAAVAGGLSFK
jgi:hypothetical protein